MALKKKFQGTEYSRDKENELYKQTFYGTEAEVDEKISGLSIGSETSGKGFLQSWRKTQSNAPAIYELEIDYSTSYNIEFGNAKDSSTVTGKKSAQLTARNIQMPLQAHPLYRTNWNYYLIAKGTKTIPSWWSTTKSTIISTADSEKYAWISSLAERPLEADSKGKKWEVLQEPQKKGYQYWDKACFVVTITEKFSSASKAGSSVKKTINTITSPEQDFNISGGNWKHDQSQIAYDGNKWIVTSVYTHSPDGWDTDLYS